MGIELVLLIALTVAAVWSVMKAALVKASIGLAVASIILTIVMFRFGAPLAAVFELSVCAGLITVIFMSTISMTKPLTTEEVAERNKERLRRFSYLPVLIVIASAILSLVTIPLTFTLPQPVVETDVRNMLWNHRQVDLLGQILVIIAGVFGVVVLFKDKWKSAAEQEADSVVVDRRTVSFREGMFERQFEPLETVDK